MSRKVGVLSVLFLVLVVMALSIGLAFWQQHKVRSVMANIVAAVEPVQEKFDTFISVQKRFPTVADMGDMGVFEIRVEGMNYMISRESGYEGSGELEVFFSDNAPVELQGQKIIFQRFNDGRWVCVTTVGKKFRSKSCNADAPEQPVYLGALFYSKYYS